MMTQKNVLLACAILCVLSACVQTPSNEIVAEGESPVRVADSYSFTEGPAADARGDVFFTDQPNNRIYRWDCETGEITLFTDQSGRSNGMFFDAQGNLIAHFPIPEDWTSNVCFGGKERNILFITASKSVYTLKMLVHGVISPS